MKTSITFTSNPADSQVDSIINLRSQLEEKLSHFNEGLLSHEIDLLRGKPDALLKAEIRKDGHALMALIQTALDTL